MKRTRLALVALPAVLVTGVLAVPLLGAAGGGRLPGTGAAIDQRAEHAYQAANGRCPGLRWELLAAIGWVESGHGTAGGAHLDPQSGEARPWIFGPALDGRNSTQRLPIGHWVGWWGLTGPYEQAVGPMQFRAPTFAAHAVDADGDLVANPHDLDDAAATAATYLCAATGGHVGDERAALRHYNNSTAYAHRVLLYADQLTGASPTADTSAGLCPVAGPTSFTDTWGAPRSGGRHHQGVDMFAARGTPVVAPVAGTVEYFANDLGGTSFRMWGDDGTYYYGTHLARWGAATGHIPAGTIVGYVGNTGNAATTPPHLHFEIHPRRQRGDPPAATNPTPTVAAWCAASRQGAVLTGRD